jgi:hypothetical protein
MTENFRREILDAIEARRDELLQMLETAAEKTQIREDLAACERLLERLRRTYERRGQPRVLTI